MKINDQVLIEAEFDRTEYLTRINFILKGGSIPLINPAQNILTAQISLDNGMTFSDVEEVDRTTLS